MIPEQPLSGRRFSVLYRLTGDASEAAAKAEDLCVEQTIEFPPDLLPEDFDRVGMLGRVESLAPAPDLPKVFFAKVSFAAETAGRELTQFLNVLFGNISIKPGIRVERLELPAAGLDFLPGPRLGREGLRRLTGVSHRALLCTALKPMGLSARNLADLARQFALGGIDIIKDDHGLADQRFAPFEDRVRACAEAVRQVNDQTGRHCLYAPNITAGPSETLQRARLAKTAGAGALLFAPGLGGWGALRELADDPAIGLPILAHPAWSGTYVMHPDHGLSHYLLYGQLARLAGADAVVYPNYGGRFSFTQGECRDIIRGTSDELPGCGPIFPCPGGGLTLDRVKELFGFYGSDVIFLIGGGLFRPGPDLVKNCRYFLELVGA